MLMDAFDLLDSITAKLVHRVYCLEKRCLLIISQTGMQRFAGQGKFFLFTSIG